MGDKVETIEVTATRLAQALAKVSIIQSSICLTLLQVHDFFIFLIPVLFQL